MVLRGSDVIDLALSGWPALMRQFEHVEKVDLWLRGRQQDITEVAGVYDDGGVFMPDGRGSTKEYADLASRAPAPWSRLVVDAVTQMMFLDGIYQPGTRELSPSWTLWQENGMDARQIPLYRAAVAHGVAYAVCMPGLSALTRDRTALIRPVSARKMAAFYDDEGEDEYPRFALRAEIQRLEDGDDYWFVRVYDEEAVYYLQAKGTGHEKDDWTFLSYDEHNLGVTPVVRYTNQIDLDGRSTGEIAPIVPLLRRIDQSTFDRLIVQRFGAWKVRYATGMAKPDTASDRVVQALRLKVEDLLVNTSPDGKFGTLDATDIAGFIAAHESDLRTLSAVTQTPPHHMLGLSSNMQAESLAAVEAGLQRKVFERKTNLGEAHEQLFRLGAHVRGDREGARSFGMQVRWRDMSNMSLAAAADGLGKLAQQVEVPVEMLWERIPGWTDSDTERAKKLIDGGAVDSILEAIERQIGPAQQPPLPGLE